MFFPDPARGLSEFRRVLRPGRRAAVSVQTVPDRSYNGQINVIVARHVPSLAEATSRTFALGGAARLQLLFSEAGFVDIETHTEKHTFRRRTVYAPPGSPSSAATERAQLIIATRLRADHIAFFCWNSR